MRTPNTWRKDRQRRREIAEAVRSEFELEPRSRFGAFGRLAQTVGAFERHRIRTHTAEGQRLAASLQPVAEGRRTVRPVEAPSVPPRSP